MKNYAGLGFRLLFILCVNALLVFSQNNQLQLNQALSLTSANLSASPITYTLPQSNQALFISVAFCSANSSSDVRFFVTNNTSIGTPGQVGGTDVFEIVVGNNGIGSVTLVRVLDGGLLAIYGDDGSGDYSFEIMLTSDGPSYDVLSGLPLLGDTTSNQALLFSPPFSNIQPINPTYPNYTLPLPSTSFPSAPANISNITLLIGPTTSFPIFEPTTNTINGSLPMTACSLRNSNITGLIPESEIDGILFPRDVDGWRMQWIVNGLQPQTNYTAYVIQDGTKVSGPINLVTKSASFSCPLVHSLPYCPKISYSVPIEPPQYPTTSYSAGNLPDTVVQPLLSYLANFTTTLTTIACGRDVYSPLQSCADCQSAYRDWLCAVSFPRCGEASPNITSSIIDGTQQSAQAILPALVPQAPNATSRNPFLPPVSMSYNILLPCLETCNAVDRACPVFLGFTCPAPKFNANDSYAVGYIDGGDASGDDWQQGGGITGVSQDRWGNIWCTGT